jgi:hypothetical protein
MPVSGQFASRAVFALALWAIATPAFSQLPVSGVQAAAAFGAGSLDGISGGIPPGAETYMGAVRISIGAPLGDLRLSAETEVSLSGRVTGKRYVQGTSSTPSLVERQGRRDMLWSILGGIEMWEPHKIGSLHVVGGMSRVTPLTTAETRLSSAAPGSDDRIDLDVSYHSTWAVTMGADLLLRFGRVSAGPTYRWSGYLGNVSPYEIGRPTRAALLGLAASYHF